MESLRVKRKVSILAISRSFYHPWQTRSWFISKHPFDLSGFILMRKILYIQSQITRRNRCHTFDRHNSRHLWWQSCIDTLNQWMTNISIIYHRSQIQWCSYVFSSSWHKYFVLALKLMRQVTLRKNFPIIVDFLNATSILNRIVERFSNTQSYSGLSSYKYRQRSLYNNRSDPLPLDYSENRTIRRTTGWHISFISFR